MVHLLDRCCSCSLLVDETSISFSTNPQLFALQEPFDKADFFGNVLRGRIAESRRFWGRVGSKRDRGIWDMTPDEVRRSCLLWLFVLKLDAQVNAYYSGPANEIAFPAGELQRW